MELLRHLEANQCAALFFSLQHQTKDQLLEAAQYLMSSTKARISQGLVEFTDWRQLMSSKQSRLKHYLSLMYLKDESLLISLLLTTVVPCRFQVGSSASSVASEIESPDKNGRGYEGRCVRRKELLETLERELPRGAIRYSSKVVSIEDTGYHKLLHLADGSTLKTKVLIGCDGVNSLVAKWLGLQKPVYSGRSAIRGFVEYPDGHVFQQRPRVYFQGGVRYGYLPCGDKFFYWFCTYSSSLQHDENMKENPAKMKQFVLSKISQLPEQALAVVERTELDSISCSPLKFRLPWNLLLGNISKGNVCVAGDALHPMTPDLGQGGCSALEDGVVLARCLAEALLKKPRDETQNEEEEYARIEKGLEKFAKERRWRSFSLISAAYVVGFIQERDGKVMSFLREKFLSRFTVGIVLKMSDFHCGELNISGSN